MTITAKDKAQEVVKPLKEIIGVGFSAEDYDALWDRVADAISKAGAGASDVEKVPVRDWADEMTSRVVNSIGYAEDRDAAIAVGMRDLAEECLKAAVGCIDAEDAIRARFPRCSDAE